MSRSIVCIGDIFGDVHIPYGEAQHRMRLLAQGETDAVPSGVKLCPGGSMPTTSALLGLRGRRPIFVGSVGSDPVGDSICGDLSRFGVCTDRVRRQKEGTVLVLIILDEGGKRTCFTWAPPGTAFGTLTDEDLSDDLLKCASHVHSGGTMVKDDGERAQKLVSFLEKCSKNGVAVSFDCNLRCESFSMTPGRRRLLSRIAECADVLFLSGVDEVAPMTGCTDLWKGARRLSNGRNTVVIRNGPDPVLVVSRDKEYTFPTFPVQVVSENGAGDAFNAGFLDSYTAGGSIETCVCMGCAFAAHAISGGGTRSIPTQRQLEEFSCRFAKMLRRNAE